MTSKNIILRIFTNGGINRINISPSNTILQLKQLIYSQTQIPVESQQLYYDPSYTQVINENTHIINNTHLKNGSCIYIQSTSQAILTPKYIEETKKHLKISDLPPPSQTKKEKFIGNHLNENENNSNLPANDNDFNFSNDNNSGFGKDNANEPHFKSFDNYIKEIGFNILEFPLLKNYKPKKLEISQMTKLPSSITLKYQPYRHVDHLELMNIEEIQSFVNYWRNDCNMHPQRCGWMFGYYKEDTHYTLGIRAVCEAIYEPPQEQIDDMIEIKNDDFFDDVIKITNKLNLELIGFIFTHLSRDQFITSKEIIRFARLQLKYINNLHYTNYPMSKFITCTISMTASDDPEPVANAFMISDLGMALVRDDLIDENPLNDSHLQLRKQKDRELFPQILESGKATTQFDADWFLVRINESAPKTVRSLFSHTHFPRENRDSNISKTALKDYFNHISMNKPNLRVGHKYADFHLLLKICKLFDLDTVYTLCDTVINDIEIDSEMEEILKSISL